LHQFTVRTDSRQQMLDITDRVQEAVAQSGAQEGLCMVFVPHTTAGVTISENADPSVGRDMLYEIDKLVPLDDGYDHSEGNSAAHLKSSLFGCSCLVPVEGGRLVLGTWQGIYFCEFDGPRTRKVQVMCR
jgi:secondary thiamine-phosphate synthase enzyme